MRPFCFIRWGETFYIHPRSVVWFCGCFLPCSRFYLALAGWLFFCSFWGGLLPPPLDQVCRHLTTVVANRNRVEALSRNRKEARFTQLPTCPVRVQVAKQKGLLRSKREGEQNGRGWCVCSRACENSTSRSPTPSRHVLSIPGSRRFRSLSTLTCVDSGCLLCHSHHVRCHQGLWALQETQKASRNFRNGIGWALRLVPHLPIIYFPVACQCRALVDVILFLVKGRDAVSAEREAEAYWATNDIPSATCAEIPSLLREPRSLTTPLTQA